MRNFHFPFLFVLFFTAFSTHAGVIIGASRLIYEGSKKEKSINIENPDSSPFLMQSWVEDAAGKILKNNTAFVVTPPLFRLEGKQKNVLRVIRGTTTLSQDKETLFWLNIKSIPARADTPVDKNTLQIAVRTRLKLIYRPKSLSKETPEQHAESLTWKRQGNVLIVSNPTKLYMNFMNVRFNNEKVSDGDFVAPESSTTIELPAGSPATGSITWKIINDFGGVGPDHNASI